MSAEPDGQFARGFGPKEASAVAGIEHLLVKEDQGVQGLIWGGSSDSRFGCEHGEEGFYFGAPISRGCFLPWKRMNSNEFNAQNFEDGGENLRTKSGGRRWMIRFFSNRDHRPDRRAFESLRRSSQVEVPRSSTKALRGGAASPDHPPSPLLFRSGQGKTSRAAGSAAFSVSRGFRRRERLF